MGLGRLDRIVLIFLNDLKEYTIVDITSTKTLATIADRIVNIAISSEVWSGFLEVVGDGLLPKYNIPSNY